MSLIDLLRPIGSNFYSCANCGKSLTVECKVLDCADCGAIFCEQCVRDGSFESHQCSEDDFEF